MEMTVDVLNVLPVYTSLENLNISENMEPVTEIDQKFELCWYRFLVALQTFW